MHYDWNKTVWEGMQAHGHVPAAPKCPNCAGWGGKCTKMNQNSPKLKQLDLDEKFLTFLRRKREIKKKATLWGLAKRKEEKDWMVWTRKQQEQYKKEKEARKQDSIKHKKKEEKRQKEELRKRVGYLQNFQSFWEQNKPQHTISSTYSWEGDSSVEVEESESKEAKN